MTEQTNDFAETAMETILEPAEQSLKEAFSDESKFAAMYAKVAEVAAFAPDLSTQSGRQKIASVARKIAKLKTRVDNFRKKAGEDHRAEINRLNGIGNRYKDQLQALQDQVREPLSKWEEAEANRVERVNGFFEKVRAWHVSRGTFNREALEQCIAMLEGRALDPDLFKDRHPEAVSLASAVLSDLRATLVDVIKAEEDAKAEAERIEAERAELEALRKEKADREAKEAAEAAERERVEREKRESEAKAQREAIEAEQAEARRIENERIAKERAELAAEQKRLEDERAEQEHFKALKRREDAEAVRRQQDAEHRAAIIAEAAADLAAAVHICVGQNRITFAEAEAIIHQIAGGTIRHVSVQF